MQISSPGPQGQPPPEAPTLPSASADSQQSTLRPFLRIVTRFASAAFWFLALTYVFGWLHARAYYTALGAPWLVPQLSQFELLSFAAQPIRTIFLAFFLALSIFGPRSSRWRWGYWVGTGLPGLALVASIMSGKFLHHDSYGTASFLAEASVLFWGIGAASTVLSIVLIITSRPLGNTWSIMPVFYFLVVATLPSVASSLGIWEAERDQLPKYSTLPRVVLDAAPDSALFLLRAEGPYLYVARL